MVAIDYEELLKMREITKQNALAVHAKTPRRKCFADHSGVQKRKAKPTFSVPAEGISKIFEAQTGLPLNYSSQMDNYWCFLSPEQIEQVEAWERAQGKTIYLRDCLSISIALDTNLEDNTSGNYTPLGALESRAKNSRDSSAIAELSDAASSAILSLTYYKDADFVCAIPPSPGKDFDLPTEIVRQVSQKTGKPDITSGLVFANAKSSVKSASFEEKWNVWEQTGLTYQASVNGVDVRGKNIILIDDKYQSGMTIQFVAMKLQQAGAYHVYGLSMVKTLRDTDNQ